MCQNLLTFLKDNYPLSTASIAASNAKTSISPLQKYRYIYFLALNPFTKKIDKLLTKDILLRNNDNSDTHVERSSKIIM